MQAGSSIVNVPLLTGLALSVAVHVAALYSRGIHTPPEPDFRTGQTVVQLTLMPSRASQAAAPDVVPVEVPVEPILTEPLPEPRISQEADSMPIPVPAPEKEAVAATSPAPATGEQAVDAVEQDASLLEDKGVIAEAAALGSIDPHYPRASRYRGEEGVVILSIEVLASGRAGRIEVLQSSGYPRLDEAAVDAARKARFTPAAQAGKAIDSILRQSFTFELHNE